MAVESLHGSLKNLKVVVELGETSRQARPACRTGHERSKGVEDLKCGTMSQTR